MVQPTSFSFKKLNYTESIVFSTDDFHMDNKFSPNDLENNYQFIVTIRNLASVYHDASVEKMDHLFFRGRKVPLQPALIALLKERPVSHALTTTEWSNILVNLGYDEDQINDFESLEVIPGQDPLVISLANYAQRYPNHSIYTALDAILKDYSHDPVLTALPDMFQKSDAQVHSLFAMADHYLDTMYPVEAELNLLVAYYEPYFDGYRDQTIFEAGAKIVGHLSHMVDELPPSVAEIASSFVLLRMKQLREYAHLNMANPDIAASLQGFVKQVSMEFEFLQSQWASKDLNHLFQTLLQPENEWLENRIAAMELSQDPRERKKGTDIRTAYLAIPCEARDQIAANMSHPNLLRSSPVGMLKQALDESTARFKLFDSFTGSSSQHQLSQTYQSEYAKGHSGSDTDSNSNSSGCSTPV